MKTSVLARNGVSKETVELLSHLTAMTPWPSRRKAMGHVTLSLLDGKSRIAEKVFGWSRKTVELGMNELRTGITCVNDLSKRRRPKTEEKNPELLVEICRIVDPKSHADPQLFTPLAYTNVTAEAVYDVLRERGWSVEQLPTVRTLSNILNRHEYRLRRVVKTKVQKKRRKPMPSSTMSGKPTSLPMRARQS